MKRFFHICCATVFLLLVSCSVQKRVHQPGFYITWKHHKQKTEPAQNPVAKQIQPPSLSTVVTLPPAEAVFASSEPASADLVLRSRPSYTDTPCDLILLRNGEEIKAKVLEVSFDLIRYKRCDYPDGPQYSVQKTEVFMVKYANGSKDVMPAPETRQTPDKFSNNTAPVRKKIQPLALVSFFTCMLALFMPVEFLIMALLMFIVSVVTGIVAVNKINAQPDTLKGKGFAITAIVISLLFAALLLLYLSVV